MCGIVGIAGNGASAARDTLVAGADAIRHRGPDDAGEWWSPDGRVGLAHRRLAVIDLSASGHQPMTDVSERLRVVFNGEIYNYRELRAELIARGHLFRSNSDTEVILASYREWSTDCLSRFDGMFAFALYDEERRQLFIARDRAGEKPLFYTIIGDTIRFASELKALLVDPALTRRVDPQALNCYLGMGFVPGDRCILQGMSKLPPAHALLFALESGQTRVWQYWQLPELDRPHGPPGAQEGELLEELEHRLEAAVRERLVADVPVGILLSGGVDSSLVTAMAARAAAGVRTFTVRFPGHGRYDETAHARLIAQHFATQHLELDAADASVDLLPVLARQFDEPIIDSSMIPTYLVSRLVRQHCTVVLGGDGGDELFGGYAHYRRLLWLERKLGWLPLVLRRVLSDSVSGMLPVGFKGRNWLQAMGGDLSTGLPLIASYFDARARRRLLEGHQAPVGSAAELIRSARIPRSADLIERATRMDFGNYLPEDILVKVDRASMLNSLEVRAPLLDAGVIEFAFGRVPANLKTTLGGRKILLKRLAARLLPARFDLHRKQGFSIPLASWLESGPWMHFFRDVLLGSHDSVFGRAFVGRLLQGQARGRANGERLFALVLFELWRREYGISI